MHASRASTVSRSSPWLWAMSAIERSMIVVDTGSSATSPATPKKPPTAPVQAPRTVWKRS